MRKFKSIFLAIVLLVTLMSTVYAKSEQNTNVYKMIPMEDGGYIIVEIDSEVNVSRATTSKTKNYTRYSENGDMVWKASLTGSFTYDGRYATCTSSSCSVTVYDSAWYTISKTTWTDANFAKGTVEMGRKVLGITTKTETLNLSMTCDRYGNVS